MVTSGNGFTMELVWNLVQFSLKRVRGRGRHRQLVAGVAKQQTCLTWPMDVVDGPSQIFIIKAKLFPERAEIHPILKFSALKIAI